MYYNHGERIIKKTTTQNTTTTTASAARELDRSRKSRKRKCNKN